MKFTPKSDQQLAEEKLLPEGQYPFEISGAEDSVSKSSGLDMIVLTVRVFRENGKFDLLTDYLSSSEKAAFKLSNICKAVHLKDKYDAGELDCTDFIGKTGYVKIGIKKDTSRVYPDKNVIGSYIVPEDDAKPVKPKGSLAASKSANIEDDTIPF